MKGFKRKIYKLGPRGNIFTIPQEVIKKMSLKAGEYLYVYLNSSGTLAYSREMRKKVPVGKYKVCTDRATLRIALQKAWMDYHELKPGDFVDMKYSGKEIIVSNGGNDGKE